MTGSVGDREPGGPARAAATDDAPLSDAVLLEAGLERAGSLTASGDAMYDDQRQQIEHLLAPDEAQALARRRLGLPRLPQHMSQRELLDLCREQAKELNRLRQDVEQARRLVFDIAAHHDDVRATLYDLMDKIEYYWLDDLP